jgi:hypothetical protein
MESLCFFSFFRWMISLCFTMLKIFNEFLFEKELILTFKRLVLMTFMIFVSKHKLWVSQCSLIILITRWNEAVISLCFSSVKLLSKQEAHAKDEKLLWELLKGKRKYQTPESPLGPKELLFSKKHHKSTTLMPSVSHRPITRILSRGLGPHSPRLDPRIPLGSSPSVAI